MSFGSLEVTMPARSSPVLDMPSAWPLNRLTLVVRRSQPHGGSPVPWDAVALSRQLPTKSLPTSQVPLGYRGRNRGFCGIHSLL